jgi:hypothetical protein
MHIIRLLLLVGLITLNFSCIPESKKEPKAGEEKSTARQVIEGFTGKTDVDNYQRTKVKIKEAGASEKKKFSDVEELAK